MDYTSSETGDDIPVYLSEETEPGHVKKRFQERFTDPTQMYYDKDLNADITVAQYMRSNHPAHKYIPLKWPTDIERFMNAALEFVEERFGLKRNRYLFDFRYYGLLIPFAVKYFSDGSPFVVINTVMHSLYNNEEEGYIKNGQMKFKINMESSLYNKSLYICEDFCVDGGKSSTKVIVLKIL